MRGVIDGPPPVRNRASTPPAVARIATPVPNFALEDGAPPARPRRTPLPAPAAVSPRPPAPAPPPPPAPDVVAPALAVAPAVAVAAVVPEIAPPMLFDEIDLLHPTVEVAIQVAVEVEPTEEADTDWFGTAPTVEEPPPVVVTSWWSAVLTTLSGLWGR